MLGDGVGLAALRGADDPPHAVASASGVNRRTTAARRIS
jgi:hypothetical protein